MDDETPLTLQQKHDLCTIAQLGCDRTTARNYIAASASQLRAELQRDPVFSQQLSRAEASAELQHMRNVHQAAQDEKNWRTSVWWLERRAPERFGRRDPRGLSPLEWSEVLRELADVIGAEIADAQVRDRVMSRLLQIAAAAAAPSDFEPVTSAPVEGDVTDDLA